MFKLFRVRGVICRMKSIWRPSRSNARAAVNANTPVIYANICAVLSTHSRLSPQISRAPAARRAI